MAAGEELGNQTYKKDRRDPLGAKSFYLNARATESFLM